MDWFSNDFANEDDLLHQIWSIEMPQIHRDALGQRCIIALVAAASTALLSAVAADTKPVVLRIEFADPDQKKVYEDLSWKQGMTVLDAMNLAKKKTPKLDFEYQGSGRTAFLRSIDGIKNQGRSGRNWIYRVDGKRGVKSVGIHELEAGAVITWKFEEYP